MYQIGGVEAYPWGSIQSHMKNMHQENMSITADVDGESVPNGMESALQIIQHASEVLAGSPEHNMEENRRTRFCKFFREGRCSQGDGCSFAHRTDELRPRPNLHRTSLCRSWVSFGSCQAGSACKFAHGLLELRKAVTKLEEATDNESLPRSVPVAGVDPDVLEQCKFANSIVAAALGCEDGSPDSDTTSTKSSEACQLRESVIAEQADRAVTHSKTRYCKFFREGKCMRGDRCTFAHGNDDIRPEPNLFRTSLCFDFIRSGVCRVGINCKFAHSAGELRGSEPLGPRQWEGTPCISFLDEVQPEVPMGPSFLEEDSLPVQRPTEPKATRSNKIYHV
mmetsp:Transcript_86815/g.156365  ORF Transcript_86815/g.156365 Transcript_86815/m.156365 type:complete len:337 (-) Transcript_86815:98-1108(-)